MQNPVFTEQLQELRGRPPMEATGVGKDGKSLELGTQVQ